MSYKIKNYFFFFIFLIFSSVDTDHGDNCSDGIGSRLLPARSHNHAAPKVPETNIYLYWQIFAPEVPSHKYFLQRYLTIRDEKLTWHRRWLPRPLDPFHSPPAALDWWTIIFHSQNGWWWSCGVVVVVNDGGGGGVVVVVDDDDGGGEVVVFEAVVVVVVLWVWLTRIRIKFADLSSSVWSSKLLYLSIKNDEILFSLH